MFLPIQIVPSVLLPIHIVPSVLLPIHIVPFIVYNRACLQLAGCLLLKILTWISMQDCWTFWLKFIIWSCVCRSNIPLVALLSVIRWLLLCTSEGEFWSTADAKGLTSWASSRCHPPPRHVCLFVCGSVYRQQAASVSGSGVFLRQLHVLPHREMLQIKLVISISRQCSDTRPTSPPIKQGAW